MGKGKKNFTRFSWFFLDGHERTLVRPSDNWDSSTLTSICCPLHDVLLSFVLCRLLFYELINFLFIVIP